MNGAGNDPAVPTDHAPQHHRPDKTRHRQAPLNCSGIEELRRDHTLIDSTRLRSDDRRDSFRNS